MCNQRICRKRFQSSIGRDGVAGWSKARSNKPPRLTSRHKTHLAFVVSHNLVVAHLIIDIFLVHSVFRCVLGQKSLRFLGYGSITQQLA